MGMAVTVLVAMVVVEVAVVVMLEILRTCRATGHVCTYGLRRLDLGHCWRSHCAKHHALYPCCLIKVNRTCYATRTPVSPRRQTP